jgi:hypothetical protein
MDHLQRVLILLMVAGIPAAAPPLSSPPSDLCLSAGSLTYRISQSASADLRVKIDPHAAHPDMRLQLVDKVESADFTIVDDLSAASSPGCEGSASLRTVRIITDASPTDITIALSSEADAALKLYVRSARFGYEDAAVLFAAMRHYERASTPHTDGDEDARPESW